MGLPVAFLAMIVSVSCEPFLPLRVHRRAVSRPFLYRCSGKAYKAASWGFGARGGLDGERVINKPMTAPRAATNAARERTTGRERVRDCRSLRRTIPRRVPVPPFRLLASAGISPGRQTGLRLVSVAA